MGEWKETKGCVERNLNFYVKKVEAYADWQRFNLAIIVKFERIDHITSRRTPQLMLLKSFFLAIS